MGRPLGFGHGCPAWPVGTGAASVGPGRDGEGATGLRVPRVWLGVSPGPEQLGRLLVPQVWGGNSSRSPSPARKGRALMGSLLAQVTRAGDELGGLRKRLGGGGGGWGDFQALRVRISCSRLGLTHRDVKHTQSAEGHAVPSLRGVIVMSPALGRIGVTWRCRVGCAGRSGPFRGAGPSAALGSG